MIAVTITISLAALLALAGLFELLGERRDRRIFPPPGRMIDIGGRRLHARVEGQGGPAVICEAGISASSVNWMVTQPAIAAFTTCVCYDRAGLGWSDPPNGPRGSYDTDRMVGDLAALLGAATSRAVRAGGALLRWAPGAALRGTLSGEGCGAGVLVDPVLACTWARPDAAGARLIERGKQVARLGVWLARCGFIRLATSEMLVRSVVVPKFGGNGLVSRLRMDLVKLPHEAIPVVRSHWRRPQNFRAVVDHLGALQASFTMLKGARVDYPITVISAANTHLEGLAEHRAVAALSSCGEHVVAKDSGHWIQVEEPQLVIDAIRRVVGGDTDDQRRSSVPPFLPPSG